MKYVGLTLGLLVLAFVIYVATGKSTAIDVELTKLAPGERQALEAVLADTGVAATQLRLVELRALKYNAKAAAIENGRVIGLRLRQVPLRHADAVVGLTGLQALWLSEDGLTTLPSLAALTALTRLDLSHNQLREVGGLAGLSALTELDLSANQITELTPLTGLPALVNLDVRNNPLRSLPTPVPARWNMKSDPSSEGAKAPAEPAAPRADRPPNWVAETPPADGKAQNVTITGLVQSLSYKVEGSVGRLRGAFTPWNLKGDDNSTGANTNLELTVESGRVRAYLQYIPPSDKMIKSTDGYLYAEAEPGKPGRIKGQLRPTVGGVDQPIVYQLVIESREGEAQGIAFRLWR